VQRPRRRRAHHEAREALAAGGSDATSSAWSIATSPCTAIKAVPRRTVFDPAEERGLGTRSPVPLWPDARAPMPPAHQISSCTARGGQISKQLTGGGRASAISATGAARIKCFVARGVAFCDERVVERRLPAEYHEKGRATLRRFDRRDFGACHIGRRPTQGRADARPKRGCRRRRHRRGRRVRLSAATAAATWRGSSRQYRRPGSSGLRKQMRPERP
jgi:hypothetical protein